MVAEGFKIRPTDWDLMAKQNLFGCNRIELIALAYQCALRMKRKADLYRQAVALFRRDMKERIWIVRMHCWPTLLSFWARRMGDDRC
jgi:hypothetical protein